MKKLLFFFVLIANIGYAQMPVILTQREQAKVIDDLLDDRLKTLLPELMRREGFDMWVVISREYNEDPVIETLLPATWMAARRTTMLVVFDGGTDKEMEYLAVSRYDVGKTFKRAWDPDHQPDQWAQLSKIIEERNPAKIGVNQSLYFGHADGISATELDNLRKSLPSKLSDHIVSAERVAIGW